MLMEAVVPLARVQRQKLVNEVTGVLVLHIGFKPLLHSALAAAWDLKLLKEVKSGNPWPHLVDLSIGLYVLTTKTSKKYFSWEVVPYSICRKALKRPW